MTTAVKPLCSRPLVALVFCVSLTFWPITALSEPESAQDLVDAGQLQLRSWLTPAEDIVVGQQVKLTLEVATPYWFTGGTRVRIPEVPGLVILQTESFAANASESRGGNTWVLQRWTLEVYPRQPGAFSIGPVGMDVAVSDGAGGSVTGRVESPAVSFSAAVPASLNGVEHWVAAPSFRVEQSFDRALDGLAVGDAFERTIRFDAEDQMAMMLPEFSADEIAGLAIYPLPPALDNRSNRGTLVATREERVSYLVEEPGDYLLPAVDYFWWDTESRALVLRSLPATTFTVGGADVQRRETETLDIDWRALAPRLLGGVVVVILGLMSLLAGRRIPWRAWWQRAVSGIEQLRSAWRRWRRPGLPPGLNPDSNAAD